MVMIAGQVQGLLQKFKHDFKSLIPIFVLCVYTIIGAIIFMLIEGPNEEFELDKLKTQRELLLKNTAYRLNTIKSMSPTRAYNHTINTLIYYREKLGVHEINLNETKWTIWGSIYFSMTVYTTIGYGNIVPITTTGRILTIIYALIGIPLALFALIALGGMFARICLLVWRLIGRMLGCFSKNLERKMTIATESDQHLEREKGSEEGTTTTDSGDDSNDELLQFPIWFLIAVTIIWILLCAYLFLLWEDTWNYGLSLYFVLISFLTVGFGDVIPSKSNYIILVGIMLLIGLALVSTMLTIIQKQIHALADDVRGKIDKDYQKALVDVGGYEGRDGGYEQPIEPIDGRESVALEQGPEKKGDKRSLDAVVARMPWRSRMLYHVMSSDNKKQLIKHAKRRQRIGTKWVQTDPYLLDSVLPVHQSANF
uniref:Potassium channel domain-containing protein n=1 Tax=Meloidogyne incognita TaxID=6306 RepID=A0A914KWH5_MELIC